MLSDEYMTAHVTLEDAHSHRTSIHHMPCHDFSIADVTPRKVVRSLRHLPLSDEIRTTWQYCNTMYITVSHAIEVITREWLDNVLRKRIWEPPNMHLTFFSLSDALHYTSKGGRGSLAHGY